MCHLKSCRHCRQRWMPTTKSDHLVAAAVCALVALFGLAVWILLGLALLGALTEIPTARATAIAAAMAAGLLWLSMTTALVQRIGLRGRRLSALAALAVIADETAAQDVPPTPAPAH